MEKGFESDESDTEWDTKIRAGFGERGPGFLPGRAMQVDEDMNMPMMVQQAFHIYDNLGEGELGAADGPEEDLGGDNIQDERGEMPAEVVHALHRDAPPWPENNDGERVDVDAENLADDDLRGMGDVPPTEMEILEESARTPLFAGAALTSLSATLFLLTCLRTHNASNMLIDELFSLLQKSMLHGINSLPKSEYAASKILKQLGLGYETIHVCPGPNTCMLFRGAENELLRRQLFGVRS